MALVTWMGFRTLYIDRVYNAGEVSSLLETFGKLLMLNYFAVSSNPAMTWAEP